MMGFSLFDPEDEENQRAMASRFAAPMPEPAPSFYQAPQLGGQGLPQPDPTLDPRMVASFLSQRDPEADTAPPYPIPMREQQGTDWGQAIGGALMGAADIFANKGRNVPAIAAGITKDRENQRQYSDQLFENDRRAYQQQGELGERKKQLALQGRNADLRQLELDAALAKEKAINERFLGNQNAEAELRAAQAELAYSQAYKNYLGEQPKVDSPEELAYKKAQTAKLEAETKALGQPKPDSAELTYRKSRDIIEDKRRAEDDARKAQQDQRQREQDQRQAGEGYSKQFEYELKAIGPLMKLEQILNETPKGADVPGAGQWDSLKGQIPYIGDTSLVSSPKDMAVKNAGDIMTNLVQRAESGAAAPLPEALGYKIRAGLAPGASEEAFKQGIGAMKEYLRGALAGGSYGRDQAARGVLDLQYPGAGEYVLGKLAQQPTAAAEPPLPPDTNTGPVYQAGNGRRQAAGLDPMTSGVINAPDVTSTPSVLPTTGQRRGQIPPIPITPPPVFQQEQERLRQKGVVFR